MSTVTENDLQEIKTLIIQMGDTLGSQMTALEGRMTTLEGQMTALEGRMTHLEENQKAVEIGQAKIEGRLEEWKPSINKISDLSEKVGELKNWKQIGVVVITAMISSLFSGTIGGAIGWLIKSGKV